MPKLEGRIVPGKAGEAFEIVEYFGRNGTPPNPGVSVAIERIEPFVRKDLHYHERSQEVFVVLGGSGLITFDGTEHPMQRGDVFHVPVGVRHRLRTEDAALEVALISCPAFAPADYILCGGDDVDP